MPDHPSPEKLLTFPCLYEYKVFGTAEDKGFCHAVTAAVREIIPISADAVRARVSSGGRYQCVSVLVHLDGGSQLSQIYTKLQALPGVRYLL